MREGKLVIITGGSKGLGYALSDFYSKKFWVVKELSRTGLSPNNVKTDLSNLEKSSESLNTLFEELSEIEWSRVVLINNIGILSPVGKIHDSKESDWISNININFTANVFVTGIFLKYFEAHSATKHIVNISSGVVKHPYHGWSLYCAGKSALESFSNCISLEQSTVSNGALTFIINPGKIDTQMQEEIRNSSFRDFPLVEKFKTFKNDGSLAQAEDVAGAIYKIIESSPENGGYYNV